MRVALLITGQVRTWKLCGNFVKNMIINNYETDVYLSIDTNNKTQLEHKNSEVETNGSELDEVVKFYDPTALYVANGDCDEEINTLVNRVKCGRTFGYKQVSDPSAQNAINYYLTNSTNSFFKTKLDINETYYQIDNSHIVDGFVNKPAFYGLIRQYYFLNKAYELLNREIISKGKEYDSVIRIRFDHII